MGWLGGIWKLGQSDVRSRVEIESFGASDQQTGMTEAIQLWTDGANGGRNGTPGGWAFVLKSEGGLQLAVSGFNDYTSNNRMELTAIIEGLKTIPQRSSVTIFTDSAYCKNPHTHGWLAGWQRKGWVTVEGSPVANRDLWEQLIDLSSLHLIKWKKVKGHTKIWSLNHVVDEMAVRAKVTQTSEYVLL